MNTLAYFLQNQCRKSIMTFKLIANDTKLFSSSLPAGQYKLECLCPEFCFRPIQYLQMRQDQTHNMVQHKAQQGYGLTLKD